MNIGNQAHNGLAERKTLGLSNTSPLALFCRTVPMLARPCESAGNALTGAILAICNAGSIWVITRTVLPIFVADFATRLVKSG
jgi:hypothetical protein